MRSHKQTQTHRNHIPGKIIYSQDILLSKLVTNDGSRASFDLTEVMYHGMAEAAQKALRATFVCTNAYTTVENNGSRTNQAPYAPSKP